MGCVSFKSARPNVVYFTSESERKSRNNFNNIDEVTRSLSHSGLQTANLIVGIDFSRSNKWTGRKSFHRKSLHDIGAEQNPYEQAISIIGRTLSDFHDNNLIPCFGFGDDTTHDWGVFSVSRVEEHCNGIGEVLTCYKELVPDIQLSGPRSFAPIIETAIGIVEQSGFQYHVLVIIADGLVPGGGDIGLSMKTPQIKRTIDAIVNAREYPLSIIVVGVGDGPWDGMKYFLNDLNVQQSDKFQFVNFTEIMSKKMGISRKEAAFAEAALKRIPSQYISTLNLEQSFYPSAPDFDGHNVTAETNQPASSTSNDNVCSICLINPKNMAFGCGHQTCGNCGRDLQLCPLCRSSIQTRINLY